MSESKTAKGKKSYSTKNVPIPQGPWLTVLEAAAYARVSYVRMIQAANDGEIPVHNVPKARNSKRVRKADVDEWLTAAVAGGK